MTATTTEPAVFPKGKRTAWLRPCMKIFAMAFRLPGDRVRVRRVERGILLEPIVTDIEAWFEALDRFTDVPFMEEGRRQLPMTAAEDLFV